MDTKITRGKESSTFTFSYLAGLFDGEGSVNLYKVDTPKRRAYTLSCIIYNNNKKLMDILHKDFGGYLQTRDRKKEHWHIAYAWKLSSNQAYNFLKQIEPFLFIKKEQAKYAIEFQDKMVKANKLYCFSKGRKGFGKHPKEKYDLYEWYYQKIRKLNETGHAATFYPQRLNEETLKKEAIVRTAWKHAEQAEMHLPSHKGE